jgi:hypothetical protein
MPNQVTCHACYSDNREKKQHVAKSATLKIVHFVACAARAHPARGIWADCNARIARAADASHLREIGGDPMYSRRKAEQ